MLYGYQIYHNYIRPHEALNGKTLSEAVGIEIQGKNKWITIIWNASKILSLPLQLLARRQQHLLSGHADK